MLKVYALLDAALKLLLLLSFLTTLEKKLTPLAEANKPAHTHTHTHTTTHASKLTWKVEYCLHAQGSTLQY